MNREECILLLTRKASELDDGRLPQRSDFSPEQICAIKSLLGPWPRALEAAGLKEKRSTDRIQKNREKRIRAKRAKRLSENENKTETPSKKRGNET